MVPHIIEKVHIIIEAVVTVVGGMLRYFRLLIACYVKVKLRSSEYVPLVDLLTLGELMATLHCLERSGISNTRGEPIQEESRPSARTADSHCFPRCGYSRGF